MIFVTVGTHEQQFNRLIEYMDNWSASHNEKVIMQTGYSTYMPRNCEWHKWFSYSDMNRMINNARIVISHGGPATFISPLQVGKTPIVVPRKKECDEHVNNHQLAFARAVADRMGTIIVVEDIEELETAISSYEDKLEGMGGSIKSNNANFCQDLEKIVDEMFNN